MKGYNTKTDKELMALLQKNDSSALSELFERYCDQLYHFFYKLLGSNAMVAEDFVQELFIKIARSTHSFNADYEVSSWMYSIAHNMVKNEYRKRSAKKRHGQHMELAFGETLVAHSNTESTVNQKLFSTELSDLLLALDEEKRDLFLMRHYLGFSVKELSEIFEIPEGTVKSRVYHITQWLSERLKHYKNEL